jgi:type I restriction enzyme S subunit
MEKEKQLSPQLRFSEFTDNWKRQKLNNILKPNITKNKEGKYSAKELLSVSSSAGVVNQIEYKGRSFAGSSVLPYNILLKNQIVYTKSPLKEYPYGIIKFNNYSNGIVSTLYATYDIKDGNDGDFIDYYFQHPFRLNKYLKPLVNIGAKNDMKVNNDKVVSDFVIFPHLKEQRKTAQFLMTIDTRIQSLVEMKELLEEYKRGVMQKIFKQELRFKNDNGKEFPKWQFKNGNRLFKTISDKNHNSDLPILAITQDHGAIPRHLIDYNIDVSKKSVSSYKVVQVGDFIISLRSFQGGIEYSEYKGICSPAYIILRPTVELNRNFYKFYLKTSSYIQELTRKLEGIRDGKMISYKYFSEIKLPFPSLEEQQKIADFISALDRKITLVNQQIENTRTYKKGLLQQMFV